MHVVFRVYGGCGLPPSQLYSCLFMPDTMYTVNSLKHLVGNFRQLWEKKGSQGTTSVTVSVLKYEAELAGQHAKLNLCENYLPSQRYVKLRWTSAYIRVRWGHNQVCMSRQQYINRVMQTWFWPHQAQICPQVRGNTAQNVMTSCS